MSDVGGAGSTGQHAGRLVGGAGGRIAHILTVSPITDSRSEPSRRRGGLVPRSAGGHHGDNPGQVVFAVSLRCVGTPRLPSCEADGRRNTAKTLGGYTA